MFYSQWCVFSIITILVFIKASKSDAFILFSGYLFYIWFIVDVNGVYYYSCSAILNLIIGLNLHFINKRAAICSYLLVIVYLLGVLLWYGYYEPTLYDNISILILVIQLITITPKGLLNGFRYNIEYITSKLAFFDSIKACVTMFKSAKTKKT